MFQRVTRKDRSTLNMFYFAPTEQKLKLGIVVNLNVVGMLGTTMRCTSVCMML